jgi:hypothetical protein
VMDERYSFHGLYISSSDFLELLFLPCDVSCPMVVISILRWRYFILPLSVLNLKSLHLQELKGCYCCCLFLFHIQDTVLGLFLRRFIQAGDIQLGPCYEGA